MSGPETFSPKIFSDRETAAAQALQAARPKVKTAVAAERLHARNVVRIAFEYLEQLRSEHFSYEDIAHHMVACGVAIETITLKRYLYEERTRRARSKAKARASKARKAAGPEQAPSTSPPPTQSEAEKGTQSTDQLDSAPGSHSRFRRFDGTRLEDL